LSGTAAITTEFRCAYRTIHAVGRRAEHRALPAWATVQPGGAGPRRLTFARDDTPTARSGPWVEGAGRHRHPTPRPAGETFVYGHVWVTLAALGQHPTWGTVALPLRADLYVRQKEVPQRPPERHWEFRTKRERAAAQLPGLKPWAAPQAEPLGVVVDGAYAKRPFLRPARPEGFPVVSRLRKDAAWWSVPPTTRRHGPRGPLPTSGQQRIVRAKRAGQPRGWPQVEWVQYGPRVTQTSKTFLATWRPASGLIRVVLVPEEHGWVPFFSTDAEAAVVDILEAAAARGAAEQTFTDGKEVWGAGEQQLPNVPAHVGACNVNRWQSSTVAAWAWEGADAALVDRRDSPWDAEPRRPSQADKRKALQREVRRPEIDAVLAEPPNPQRYRELADKLLDLAAGEAARRRGGLGTAVRRTKPLKAQPIVPSPVGEVHPGSHK
jgi:hypothetical protein